MEVRDTRPEEGTRFGRHTQTPKRTKALGITGAGRHLPGAVGQVRHEDAGSRINLRRDHRRGEDLVVLMRADEKHSLDVAS